MTSERSFGLVLAIHPTSRGFGWVLFEGPRAPVLWGNASAKFKRSATSMKRFAALLRLYEPSTLILEQYDGPTAHRSQRIQDLAQTMRGFAEGREIDVVLYTREVVGREVAGDPKATRHIVARATALKLPFFRRRLPHRRSSWQSEDERQSLFDALALALTHYNITRPKG